MHNLIITGTNLIEDTNICPIIKKLSTQDTFSEFQSEKGHNSVDKLCPKIIKNLLFY